MKIIRVSLDNPILNGDPPRGTGGQVAKYPQCDDDTIAPHRLPISAWRAARPLAAALWAVLVLLSFATSVAAESWRVQDGVNLNTRSGPGTEYAIVETLPAGTVVEELERTGRWSRIRTGWGHIVFVSNRYLVREVADRELQKLDVGESSDPEQVSARGTNIHLQSGHSSLIFTVAFSPDGRTVATAGGTAARLWDVTTGRELRMLEGHSGEVSTVAFSPDGRTVATGSRDDNTARLWDVATGRELRVLGGHSGTVTRVAFSPDGRTVATAGGTAARLWDVTTGRELRALQGHPGEVYIVAFSPDGRTVATGSRDTTARLWDVTTGQELRVLEGHSYGVFEVVFSPDGGTLATRSWDTDSTARLWDMATGRELRVLRGHSGGVSTVAFSPDGRTVATGSRDDNTVRLWDVATGRELRVLGGHSGTVTSVAFSPDGRTVLTGSYDSTARLWDATTGRELRVLDGHSYTVTRAEFSPDGHTLATGSWDNTARLWDVATGRELRVLKGNLDTVTSIAFSPDGRTVLTGSYDTTARLWDAATGRELRVLGDHSGSFTTSVAFSPDGRTVATGSRDNTARLWDVATGRELRALDGHSDWVTSVAFSPDGRALATGSWDRTARLWDVATGRELRVLEEDSSVLDGRSYLVNSVAFSPDGRTVVTSDHTARLWDVATGRKLRVIEGHSSDVNEEVAFSPDGRTVATAEGTAARLWDVATGRELRVLEGHLGSVASVAFSPDGRTVATGSRDTTARLWDVTTGRELRVLEGHLGGVASVAFSPDGRTVAGSVDRTVRLWEAATGRELAMLSSFNDGSSIVLTPEGFFNASKNGAQHLNLVRGLDVLSMDQVYDALYRPDLVREALAGDPEGKVAAAAARLDLDKVVASGLPPRLVELRSLDGETVDGDAATVSVDIEERDGGIGRVEWRVNGTVQEARGLSGLLSAEVDTVQLEKRVFLAPGENVVSVVIYNEANLIASDPREITLTSTRTSVSKPSLHVLAAGVNDYYDSRLELKYAVPDARALGTALQKAGRGLYESVNITYLLDEQVSVKGVSEAFAKLSEQVRPHDAFVFFLAGHGKTVDGRYYFLPREFRYLGEEELERTAISQGRLQEWVAQVPAQKSVLLFDTCESGSLTEEMATRGLEEQAAIARLSRAVGRTILTASTDTAPALEGYRQHGLFTYTLLEALALADHDEDGAIEVNELIGYVDERLPALSEASFGFRQVPTHWSQGGVFALGKPVTVLSESEELIPRTSTHVVNAETDLLESPQDPDSVLETLTPGTQVRVVESADGWAHVARDGAKLGWVETSKLWLMQ